MKVKIVFAVFGIFIACVLCVVPCLGNENGEANRLFHKIFYKANRAYESSNFQEAIDQYEEILASGFSSANLYYNLANAYFKVDDLGHALLNYERALRLNPGDRDLLANSAYARSLIRYGASDTGSAGFFGWLNMRFGGFSVNNLCWLASGFFFLILCMFVARIFKLVSMRLTLASCISFILVLVICIAVIGNRLSKQAKEAIVLDKDVSVRFEPKSDSSVYFNLYEGMKVSVVRCRGGFCRVMDRKKSGWVSKDSLAIF